MAWSLLRKLQRTLISAGTGAQLAVLPALVLLLTASGCASYKAHYTSFEADNSEGEERQVRLTWRTAEYPFWHWREDRATPIKLETQCSRRVWQIRDPSMDNSCDDERIAGCGDPALDLDRERNMLISDDHVCVTLSDGQGTDRVMDLEGEIELDMGCFPRTTEVDMGDEMVNADYLRASAVPYNLRVRSATLGSMTERPPELDERVCELDD